MWDNILLLIKEFNNPVLYAIPFFYLFILIEIYINYKERMEAYETKDTIASLVMGTVSGAIDLLAKSTAFVLMFWLYQYRLFDDFLTFHWWAWGLLLFADDFSFYWHHRLSHQIRLLWAAHVNHHSSEQYNLSTALRQSWTELFYKYLFYLWLAFLGFHPIMILTMISISLIYQFWVHTKTVGKLPAPLEFIFNTPSHHRVHHASNPIYLDKNHGGIFIFWDRLFGTFQEELEEVPVVYGITNNIKTFNPLRIATHEFRTLYQVVKRAPGWKNKLKYIFKPPGWSHDGSSITVKELHEELGIRN